MENLNRTRRKFISIGSFSVTGFFNAYSDQSTIQATNNQDEFFLTADGKSEEVYSPICAYKANSI